MKNLTGFILLLLVLTSVSPANAAIVIPGDSAVARVSNASLKVITPNYTLQNVNRSAKKSSFVERLKLRLIQKTLLRKLVSERGEPTDRQKRQGKASMILGISSIVALVIPGVNLLAIPAAIVAIVLGAISLKGNSNSQGIVGLVTGSVTVLLFILFIIVVLTILGNGF
ncbi:MAG: hypothetical protein WKF70_02555 [Chitinophagaceae bacterium]